MRAAVIKWKFNSFDPYGSVGNMPSQPTPRILLTHFDWSIHRLEEILKNEKTDYYRDASLQRFGFTCGLALKCLHTFAAERSQTRGSPHEYFELAAENHWLDPAAEWKEMVESYQRISHKLQGPSADAVYSKLNDYCLWMKSLHENLEELAD